MQSRQRYVVVGVLALAIIASMALSRGFHWLWVQFGWSDPALFSLRDFPLTTALGYAVGLGAALFCLKHRPTRQLASEVVDELAKVTWPSREETGSATVVVIVTVILCSAYLGVFDAFWLWLTDWVMGVPGATPGQ